jgi:hypothetical protein
MGAKLQGITLALRGVPSTPNKTAKITGISLTLDLRTGIIFVYRYDPATRSFVPLENYPIVVRLIDSAQQTTVLTNQDGRADTEFPDINVEFRLSPNSVPAGHSAKLNYLVRAGKREDLTVVFIPDNLPRFYPNIQSL